MPAAATPRYVISARMGAMSGFMSGFLTAIGFIVTLRKRKPALFKGGFMGMGFVVVMGLSMVSHVTEPRFYRIR